MSEPRREGPPAAHADEIARIRAEYARRGREAPVYEADWRVRMFVRQRRERDLIAELSRAGALPLTGRRVLDVGCGVGQWLADLETWGARRADLAGIELDSDKVGAARERLGPGGAGGADVREGDAAELPWADGSFDLVLQATLLSSILDAGLRRRIAGEMARVLAPDGLIVSYDMRVGNPRNRHVRAVGRRELRELFPGFDVRARRVRLLPPLARRLARVSWAAAGGLERARVANTHLLAVLRRTPGGAGSGDTRRT